MKPKHKKVIRPLQRQEISIKTVKKALKDLSLAMQIYPEIARAWHYNLAMMAQDAGAPHDRANERASDFMRAAFGVDTRILPIGSEDSSEDAAVH